jgi:hypothetical protein
MNKKIIFTLLVFFTAITSVFSQEYYKRDQNYLDTATFMIWASPKFAVHVPFGSGYLPSTFNVRANKFNCNYAAGLDFTIKTKSNWTISFAFDYMFGSKVSKPPHDVLGDMFFYVEKQVEKDDSLITEKIPVIFNGEGNNAVALSYEGRYWFFGATVGKIIPLDRWKNSGLWFKFSLGYFGHKIHFTDPNSYFPQIDQKYRYGYDQRSSAVALNQFFGYLFMQKRRVLSFYIGIELWEVFSKPDRGYIFAGDLAGPTDLLPRKFSGLLGLKFGWNLPLYEKKRVTTYYYY